MPYAVEFTDTAFEDIERLVDTLPLHRQARALDEIEAACLAFAERPVFRPSSRAPNFPLHFIVEGTHYYWGATYQLHQDEARLIITHVFRIPL